VISSSSSSNISSAATCILQMNWVFGALEWESVLRCHRNRRGYYLYYYYYCKTVWKSAMVWLLVGQIRSYWSSLKTLHLGRVSYDANSAFLIFIYHFASNSVVFIFESRLCSFCYQSTLLGVRINFFSAVFFVIIIPCWCHIFHFHYNSSVLLCEYTTYL